MSVIYEWDAEEWDLECDGSIKDIHHNHHNSATCMVKEIERFKSTDHHPVVVRDEFDEQECLRDRQWAYITTDEDGVLHLPEFFMDGLDMRGAKVPQRLHKELAMAQKK